MDITLTSLTTPAEPSHAEDQTPAGLAPHPEPDGDETDLEEIGVQELFEMLIAEGLLSVEDAEKLAGEDLDGDDEYWEVSVWRDDNSAAAAGARPDLIRAIKETLALQDAKQAISPEGGVTSPSLEYMDRGRGLYHEIMSKGVAGVARGGKYKERHMTPSGNWSYTYSTGSGAVAPGKKGASGTGSGEGIKRIDNRQKATSTSGQRHEGVTSSTGNDQHHNPAVKQSKKGFRVRAHNPAEAKKVGRLIASGRLKKR